MIDTMNKYITTQNNAKDCNCWGSSISMGKYGFVSFNVDNQATGTIHDPNRADEILESEFKQTDKPKFGDVRRYAFTDGNKRYANEFNLLGHNRVDDGTKTGGTSHYATFLLQNGAGTVYVFSKNGAGSGGLWTVDSESKLLGDQGYGQPTPIGKGSPNYTKK